MTIHEFLNRTATINSGQLRPALARALRDEIPRTRAGYARFYRRVIGHLDGATEATHTPLDGVRLTVQPQPPCRTASAAA